MKWKVQVQKGFACEGFLYEARENRMKMKLMLPFQGRDFVPLITLLQLEKKNLFSSLICFLHKENIQF